MSPCPQVPSCFWSWPDGGSFLGGGEETIWPLGQGLNPTRWSMGAVHESQAGTRLVSHNAGVFPFPTAPTSCSTCSWITANLAGVEVGFNRDAERERPSPGSCEELSSLVFALIPLGSRRGCAFITHPPWVKAQPHNPVWQLIADRAGPGCPQRRWMQLHPPHQE